jgi:DNA-binding response OmpR family regulator
MTLAELDVLEPLVLSGAHTVVLVDDEPAVLRSLKRALRHEPYEVRTTTRAEEALDWIRRGDVSLVVLDQRMPGMCGTELAEQVRRLSPQTVRVMLTAYPGNALVRHGLDHEVQWLISKPWNDDALRLALRRLLRDHESPSPPAFLAMPDDGAPRCVEERGVRIGWGTLKRAIRRAASAFLRGSGWILGFLWMADAGGMTLFGRW